jgi:hypothetical protein
MIDELVKIWKEVVMAIFKVLCWYSPGGTEESHKNLRIACLQAEV